MLKIRKLLLRTKTYKNKQTHKFILSKKTRPIKTIARCVHLKYQVKKRVQLKNNYHFRLNKYQHFLFNRIVFLTPLS